MTKQVNKDGTYKYKRCNDNKNHTARTNIWKFKVGNRQSTHDQIAFQHPAIFPEKLAEDHMLTWSNPGDIVLDPLGGSGTTAKMAKKNNRTYIMIEILPKYC